MNAILIHNIPPDCLLSLATIFAVRKSYGWAVPEWVNTLYIAAGLPGWPYTYYVGIEHE